MEDNLILDVAKQQQKALRELEDMQLQINTNANKMFIPSSKKLEEIDVGVTLLQKFELLENIAPCEYPNIYYVYKMDKNKNPKGD